jgi:hypothetical protein
MAAIPKPTNDIQALIDKAHEARAEHPREHMGCSVLGHSCDRWLWMSFRWAVQQKPPGRVIRIFRRGHAEEANIVADLRAIGMDVRNAIGKNQARVDLGAHVAGSVDAIIESGVPEAPKKRHVAEFKTCSLKVFIALQNKGVKEAKFEHYVQMQLYMHGTQIDRALYLAVCKDDDRIYTERVAYDKATAEKYIERGRRIALSDRMPEPISTNPSWHQCKTCPAYDFCHDTKITQHVNCRTCAHSTAKEDSTWRCERHDSDGIPVEFQRQACESHVLHPDLVPWERKDGADQWTAIYVVNGKDVANGEPRGNVYSSSELLANPEICTSGDEYVAGLRETFNARIIG